MILIKCGLTLVLCVLARGHEKRDLGFTGLGTYHGGNDGPSPSHYSVDQSQQNSIDRQGKIVVPEYTGGLSNFASTSHPVNTQNYDNTNAANHINLSPLNSPIIVPNVGLQYGANHGMPHNAGYGSLNPGLNIAPSSFNGPIPNPIIPVHEQTQSSSHLISPMRHIQFPAMQDFRNPSFLQPAASPAISIPHDPTFGQRFLPTGNNQGFYGHGHGILPISHGQYDFGSFQQNQPAFGHYAPSIPIIQGISHPPASIPAFHGHGVNNLPIIPFPVNPPAVGHINTFPVGDGANIPNDHYGNTNGDTASTPEVNQENHSTHDTGDVPNDSYSPQSGHTDEGTYEGNTNSGDDTTNHHPSDVNNDYHDNYNIHSNENSKGNSYEINHSSYPTSSQEVRGDSVGSYVGSDSSQIGQGTSAEQKYGSTSERSSSQIHDQPTSKVNSARSRNDKGSSLVTNGHAVGHDENGQKATSFQSFVIHSYKPKRFYPKKNSHKSFEGVFGQSDTFIDIPVEHHKH